jgi:predicted  nucleic acid-binding Zn-ribbon protein
LPQGFASPSEPGESGNGSGGISASELSRLIGISTQLASLNERLRNELSGSRKNSAELSNMLNASMTELEALRAELELLRRTSEGLLSTAEKSNQESEGLKIALTKAESSLASLEQSFSAYRMTAEKRIQNLERSNRFRKYGFITAAVLAVSGWAAFAVSAAN